MIVVIKPSIPNSSLTEIAMTSFSDASTGTHNGSSHQSVIANESQMKASEGLGVHAEIGGL